MKNVGRIFAHLFLVIIIGAIIAFTLIWLHDEGTFDPFLEKSAITRIEALGSDIVLDYQESKIGATDAILTPDGRLELFRTDLPEEDWEKASTFIEPYQWDGTSVAWKNVVMSADASAAAVITQDRMGLCVKETMALSVWYFSNLGGWTAYEYPPIVRFSDDGLYLYLIPSSTDCPYLYIFQRNGNWYNFHSVIQSPYPALSVIDSKNAQVAFLTESDWVLYNITNRTQETIADTGTALRGGFSGDGKTLYFVDKNNLLKYDIASKKMNAKQLNNSGIGPEFRSAQTDYSNLVVLDDNTLVLAESENGQLTFVTSETAEIKEIYSLINESALGDKVPQILTISGYPGSTELVSRVLVTSGETGKFSYIRIDPVKAQKYSWTATARLFYYILYGILALILLIWVILEIAAAIRRRNNPEHIAEDPLYPGLDTKAVRLFKACIDNKPALVKRLTKGSGGQSLMECRNAAGVPPLIVAAFMQNSVIVKTLLEAGANPNTKDKDSNTALIAACLGADSKKAQDLISCLLDKGADPCLLNKQGVSASKLCAEKNYLNVLELLWQKNPGVLSLANDDRVTPAYSAAEENHIECFTFIAEKAPESLKICRISDNASPAYVATFHNHHRILEIIERTAPETFTLPGPGGYLPSTIAALKGHYESALVIARIAPETFNHKVKGENNITPALLAAQNGFPRVLEIIANTAPKSFLTPKSSDKSTPAHAAAFKGHADCLEILAKTNPAILSERTSETRLPAFFAAQEGHIDCLKIILNYAPETLMDNTEGSPAFIAAQMGQMGSVQFFAEQKPEALALMFGGSNALHVAAVLGKRDIVEYLIKQVPTLDIPNEKGNNATQMLEQAEAEAREKEKDSGGIDTQALAYAMFKTLFGDPTKK